MRSSNTTITSYLYARYENLQFGKFKILLAHQGSMPLIDHDCKRTSCLLIPDHQTTRHILNYPLTPIQKQHWLRFCTRLTHSVIIQLSYNEHFPARATHHSSGFEDKVTRHISPLRKLTPYRNQTNYLQQQMLHFPLSAIEPPQPTEFWFRRHRHTLSSMGSDLHAYCRLPYRLWVPP